MRVLLNCSYSGFEREAFRALGHDAWSCDLLPSEDGSPFHIQGDAFDALKAGPWDLTIFHAPCTYLANSGVRWLYPTDPGDPVDVARAAERWDRLRAGAAFFRALWDASIAVVPAVVAENPIMHKHGKALLGLGEPTQIIQPHWFGDHATKATCHWRHGPLPDLKRTHWLAIPRPGTDEYKRWNAVWLAPPGPDRWKDRSRAFPGLCKAEAKQWGGL